HGMLPQFKFQMNDTAAKQSFYWGVMTESRIDAEKLLFKRKESGNSGADRKEIKVSTQNLFIGRKRRARENAQASPIYLLRVVRDPRLGEIDLKVVFERDNDEHGEEIVRLVDAEGVVDNQPAEIGRNVL